MKILYPSLFKTPKFIQITFPTYWDLKSRNGLSAFEPKTTVAEHAANHKIVEIATIKPMLLVILNEVDVFIETLEKSTRSKWLRQLTLLEHYGEVLGMPHVRHISSGMRELRVRGFQEIRAFFVFQNNQAIIVHAFIKKTQKTPQKEIITAQRRVSQLLTLI